MVTAYEPFPTAEDAICPPTSDIKNRLVVVVAKLDVFRHPGKEAVTRSIEAREFHAVNEG